MSGRRLLFGGAVGCALIVLLVLCLELGLRVLLGPELSARQPDPEPHRFWVSDSVLGWDNAPDTTAVYSDGHFRGRVTIDENGVRLNGPEATDRDGYANLLFLGDSTAVSLEVDDEQTIPARLEEALRSKGARWNVINLGVRGYGTDQVVDKAIRATERLETSEAIYLFVPNDVYETNLSKAWGHPFSKPVYLWNPVGRRFGRLPPIPADPTVGRLAVLDATCRPYMYETTIDRLPEREVDSWLSSFYLYRAWWRFVREPRREREQAARDPHEQIRSGVDWRPEFAGAYLDDGLLRGRCADFFEMQMRFHLERLRRDAGIEKLHVVHFPHARVVANAPDEPSPNVLMFRSLLSEGVIDSYLDLNAEIAAGDTRLEHLRCRSDPHFCPKGNAWAAERIVEHAIPHGTSP